MLKKIALLLLLIAPMSVFAQKFGHIKSADVLTVMPEFTKAQTDIQAMQKQYEDEMKRATDELTKKYTEYQQEQANLPKNIQERDGTGITGKRNAVPTRCTTTVAEIIR
jgi:outer membrane protein